MANTFPMLSSIARVFDLDENATNAAPTRLAPSANFVDPNFGLYVDPSTSEISVGGHLTVGGVGAGDIVSLATDSDLTISSNQIFNRGKFIGTFSGGVEGDFQVVFHQTSTDADARSVLQHLQFQNVSDNPVDTRTLTIDIRDCQGVTAGYYESGRETNPFSFIQPNTYTDIFEPGSPSKVSGSSTPAFTDVNLDGVADLVMGSADGTLRTFLRSGSSYNEVTGTSADPFQGINAKDNPNDTFLTTAAGFSRPAFGDVNGDGLEDLVLGTTWGFVRTFVRIPSPNGDGPFIELRDDRDPFKGLNIGSNSSPALGDINGDGRDDLVVGGGGTGTKTYIQNSDHSFSNVSKSYFQTAELTRTQNWFPTIVDFSGDGINDVIFSHIRSFSNGNPVTDIVCFQGSSDGTFAKTFANPFTIPGNPAGIHYSDFPVAALVDLDGDRQLELVVGSANGTLQTYDYGPRRIVINIAAENDPAEIHGTVRGIVREAGGAANSVAGAPIAAGQLAVDDVDSPAAFDAVPAGTASTGGYGTYALTSAGAWTYTLDDTNPAVEALKAGDLLTDTFTVQAADGTTKVVTITINGANDAAVITGTSTGSVTEASGVSNGTPGLPNATGTLVATDVDSATTFKAVAAGTASTGGYGTYAITSAGVWTYTLDNSKAAVQALNIGQTLTDTFTVLTADGTSRVVAVTINGANDAAVITGTSTGSVTEAGGVANGIAGTPTATGTLVATDVDSATTFQAKAAGTASTGGYGTYAITSAGVWTYTLDNSKAAVQALNVGQTLTDTFTALTADGTAQTVTVTINGANDAAVITGTSTGSVTEASGVSNGMPGVPNATGTLAATDVDSATTFKAVVAGTASAGGYGTYAMTSAGIWTYTLDNTKTAVQALNVGQSLTDTFSVQSADGTSQTVTVTINGANDAATITGNISGYVFEAGNTPGIPAAGGFLYASDVDNPANTFQAVTGAAASTGGYGTYTVTTNGHWIYTLDDAQPAVQALNSGRGASDTFTVKTVDGTSQVVTIQIYGTNDRAVITGTTTGSVTEAGGVANGTAGTPIATGTLVATDVDDAPIFRSVPEDYWQYGSFQMTSAGKWTYRLFDTSPLVQALNVGDTLSESFYVYTQDNTRQTITITINGANDAAVITGTASGSVTEAVTGSSAASVATGALGATDVDSPATFNAVAAGTASAAGFGTYAMTSAGVWTYALDNAATAVQALNVGQMLTDTFSVQTADGTSQTVTVTINGANDAAVITGATTGNVVEASGVLNDVAGVPTARGTLVATDVDSPATFQPVAAGTASSGGHGTYAVRSTGVWTYTLDDTDPAVEALSAGQTLTDTFTVRTEDGTSQVVTVTISGRNDGALYTTSSDGLRSGWGGESVTKVVVAGSASASLVHADGTTTELVGYGFADIDGVLSGIVTSATRIDPSAARPTADQLVGIKVGLATLVQGGTLTPFLEAALGGDDVVIGGSGGDVLFGYAGNDRLDGRAGVDLMTGGAGDDIYVVDTVGDTVVEDANGGADMVEASLSWSLGGDNVENLTLVGSGAFVAGGNGLANVLTGNTGDNTLDGRGGADTMRGGLGNDTYVVENAGDVVVELAGEGTDTVNSYISYGLGADVENLSLLRSADLSGTGNALANVLIGNAGANRLDGAGGIDTMIGGAGNDTYVVDDVRDVVVEATNGGTDTVEASLSWSLGDDNVENLTLTGTGSFVAGGNGLDNVLVGNGDDNTLDGRGGIDTMRGGLGDDTYVVDNAFDLVLENANEGVDTVNSYISYALGSNVENLSLMGSADLSAFGNELGNVLIGNAGANRLDGGVGIDTMIGGLGDDAYVVNDVHDVVVEVANGGIDTIEASLSWSLGHDNVENLTLVGTGAFVAGGNELDNVLIGNTGDNTLDGRGGADTMRGGLGNDTYVVESAGDVVVEFSGEGVDTVNSYISYALGANVENLSLMSSADLSATGNTSDNLIIGNGGANILDGGWGRDTLFGGQGDDTFVFVFGPAAGDTVLDFAGNGAAAGDALRFVGYGTAAQGASLTQIDATHWAVNSAGGHGYDVITLANGATIHPSDYLFV